MESSISKLSLLFISVFLTFSLTINGQEDKVQMLDVPSRMEFGGVQLKLTDQARDKVADYAAKLMENNYYFRKKVERADAYFPIIERVLKEEGVPEDFKYLVLQESGLVSDVESSSKAVGFWQFKKATAMEVGLQVDNTVDERKNIVTSTRGAAKYLSTNQGHLQNWTYTLLSYYAGLSGAKSVMGEEYIGAKRMTIDKQTHWYIIKFLAHRHAFESSVARNPNPPLVVLEYPNAGGKTLKEIAKEKNIDLEDLQDYNKWVAHSKVPENATAPVILPVKLGDYQGLIAEESKVEENPAIRPWHKKAWNKLLGKTESATILTTKAPLLMEWNGIKAIQARKEDNIDRLAMQAGISKELFMRYNDLKPYDWIVEGQVYYIRPKKRKGTVPFHVVEANETIWEISQNYGIKIRSLLRKNRMDKPRSLKAGRILWLRERRPKDHPVEYKPLEKPVEDILLAKAINTLEGKNPEKQPLASNEAKGETTGTAEIQKTIKKLEASIDKSTSSAYAVVTPGKGNTVAPEGNTTKIPSPTTHEKHELKKKRVEVERNEPDTIEPFTAEEVVLEVDQEKEITATEILEIEAEDPAKVQPKQKLKEAEIGKDPAQADDQKEKPTHNPATDFHVVSKGETLFRISMMYGVRAEDLQRWNKMDSPALSIGQKLLINAPENGENTEFAVTASTQIQELDQEEKSASAQSSYTYQVRKGDTLYSIARQNGVSVQQIMEWNKKNDPSLALGEKLVIKL